MTSPMLQIETFCLGDWMTNCFVLRAGGTSCWFVDAGFAPQPMIEYVASHRLEPQMVLLTHAHVDHIAGLHALRAVWPTLPILIHDSEREFLTDPLRNLSAVLAEPVVAPPATETLGHGQTIQLDGCDVELRHTPGHSPGGMTLLHSDGDLAIVGDTLFAGSIGRTDFPTSDHDRLMASIREQLLTLPDHTTVMPGHGPQTTIGDEKANNPFVGEL